ncbi:MAG: hypothetical protein J2P48_14550 [Alphaproteobacteria bacterium]|nr:hypothetical protein [Alphaproteobacteria bacterium]
MAAPLSVPLDSSARVSVRRSVIRRLDLVDGIDKHLAQQARMLRDLTKDEFEPDHKEGRERILDESNRSRIVNAVTGSWPVDNLEQPSTIFCHCCI